MSSASKYPVDVFTSLKELLEMERFAQFFRLFSKSPKVKSILGGKHASKLRGRGLDFEEVRNYVSGDDIRNIDWKVTARTKVTHTRVFSEEKEKPALIIVDQSKSMFFGSEKRTKAVVAAELAALAAFRVLKQGDRIGGIVIGDEGIDYVQPKRDRRNILRFLDKVVQRNQELIDSKPGSFEESLKEVIKKTRNLVTHDYLVVVISDFHRYSPEVIKFIAQIAQHNDLILSKVIDPMEREIPTKPFVAGDQTTQITVDGADLKIQKRFTEGFDKDVQDFETEMKRHRIPLLKIDTVTPIDQQIKALFRS